MAAIYLRHPVHGEKVATMDAEARYDEMHGWRRFDPNEVINDVEVDEVEPAVIVNAIAPKRRSRRLSQPEA